MRILKLLKIRVANSNLRLLIRLQNLPPRHNVGSFLQSGNALINHNNLVQVLKSGLLKLLELHLRSFGHFLNVASFILDFLNLFKLVFVEFLVYVVNERG